MSTIFFFGVLLLFVGACVLIVQSITGSKWAAHQPFTLPPLFAWAAGTAVLGMNFFFYDVEFGIGAGLFGIAMIAALLMGTPKARRTPLLYTFAGIGIGAGLLTGFRGNEFVQGVNSATLTLCVLAMLLLQSMTQAHLKGLWMLRGAVHYAINSIRSIPGMAKVMTTVKGNGSSFTRILRTVIITAVVFIFFANLLSSADPIFSQKIAEVREQFVGRTVASVFLLAILAIGLGSRVDSRAWGNVQLKFLSYQEIIFPVIAAIGLFALFLSVQAQYLFGSHADFQTFGITYSEYVRKGFLELLVATFFGGVLGYVVTLKRDAVETANHKHILQAMNLVLIAELFLMLLSALKRDAMYMEMYGLTRVRVIGTVFLVWLAGLFVLLAALTVLRRMQEKHFLIGTVALSAVVVLSLNVMNMDLAIAKATPPRSQKPDVFYTAMLSPDAASTWVGIVEDTKTWMNGKVTVSSLSAEDRQELANRKLALLALKQNVEDLQNSYTDFHWQEWSFSKVNARILVQENSALFSETLNCTLKQMNDYGAFYNISTSEEENSRLYNFNYPFVRRLSYEYYPVSMEETRSMSQTNGTTLQKPTVCP